LGPSSGKIRKWITKNNLPKKGKVLGVRIKEEKRKFPLLALGSNNLFLWGRENPKKEGLTKKKNGVVSRLLNQAKSILRREHQKRKHQHPFKGKKNPKYKNNTRRRDS